MSIDIIKGNLNSISRFEKEKNQPLLTQKNIGKRVIRQNRTFVRSRRSKVQRAFDMFFSMGPNRGLLNAIRDAQTVSLSQRFMDEGGVQPLPECRDRAKEILRSFSIDKWLPKRIGASLVGGIMLVYRFPDGSVFEVEVENDLVISCVVSKGKSVTYSEEFIRVADLHRFVKHTQSQGHAAPRL